ncbi:MAG: hypothetical protein IPK85_03115 [Gemmatimonadetes bacterium]|nr:hypothetical protein [Gemmatimonadota bacterium]
MDDLTREAIEDLRRRVDALEQVPPNPFAALRDTIARMRPSRPAGEENDTATVTEVRKILSDAFDEILGENLAMRPTIELLQILVEYARMWKPADAPAEKPTADPDL